VAQFTIYFSNFSGNLTENMQNTALQDHFYLMKRGRLGNNETPGTLRKKTQQKEGFDLPAGIFCTFACF
jgi:hypothetical protein